MTPLITVLNQAAQPPALLSFLPLIVMFVIFYFLLIRPQKKQQDEMKKFVANLEKNQEVITAGGVHGTIVQVKDSTVMLRIADDVKVEVERSSVVRPKKASA